MANPPAVGLGVALDENTTVRRRLILRNVSRRALDLTLEPGTADAADIVVEVLPQRARLKPGASLRVSVAATVPLLPRAPAALGGALRIKVRGGTTLKIPWAIAVPPAKRDLIPVARLSSRTFVPSDVEPAVLTVVAGRVDGTAERPQLLPLEQLAIELYRGEKYLGRLALVRDLLPGPLLVRHHRPGPGRQAPAAGRLLPPPHRHADRRRCDGRADRPVHDLVSRERRGDRRQGARRRIARRAPRGYSRHVVSDGVHA